MTALARVSGAVLLASAALGLGGCIEFGLARSIAFPPSIPGLDGGQPWVRLPVDSWVTEAGVEPIAIAGCFAPECAPRAAVALLRARGREADRLARAADEPQRLAQALLERKPRPRTMGTAPRPEVSASAERIREGRWAGFSLDLARRDGSRPAHGIVLTRRSGSGLLVLIVISDAEAGARRIARDFVAHQG